MQKVVAFLKLIRYKNLLIVALTQFLIRFSLTETFLPFPALTKSHFLLFVITTVLITASGYIINDIYDVKTDRINKKRNTIIGVYLKERNAMNWYFILNGPNTWMSEISWMRPPILTASGVLFGFLESYRTRS